MSTQKKKFELFARLANLGFTYDEAVALRRIEMTLRKWSEDECNGYITRDEESGKTFRVIRTAAGYANSVNGRHPRYPIADRERGALKRLNLIVAARNAREYGSASRLASLANLPDWVYSYHQPDPRGCALYLVKASDLPDLDKKNLDGYYNRGVAVCA